MLTTPSLRNLAREHFYEEEAEMVPAIAARLGVSPDSLVAHVVTGMVTSAVWATVNRWLAEGPELDLDRLNEMMDETFALLADGVDRAVAAARDLDTNAFFTAGARRPSDGHQPAGADHHDRRRRSPRSSSPVARPPWPPSAPPARHTSWPCGTR